MKILMCAMVVLPLWTVSATHAADLTGRWASSSDSAAKTITALEDMWAHTSCSSVPPALKAAFAEDFQGTAPNGQRYGRPKSNWGGSGDHSDCKLEKIQIRVFGDSVAIAYGNESSISKKDGKELKHCLAWTDTWLKRNGQWQILAAQDNLVTCQSH